MDCPCGALPTDLRDYRWTDMFDLRYALRGLLRTPGFTVTAVAVFRWEILRGKSTHRRELRRLGKCGVEGRQHRLDSSGINA